MKLNKLGFARKWQHPLLLFSGVLPVAVMLGVHNMPGREYVPMLPLILYLFLGWLCLILPGEKRLAMGMVCCVGLVVVSHFLLPWWEHRALLLVPLAAVVMMGLTLPMPGWEFGREVPIAINIGFVLLHAFALAEGQWDNSGVDYGWTLWVLYGNFVLFCTLAMFAMNRSSLKSAAVTGQKPPESMRRKNRILSVGMLVLTFGIGCLPAVIDGVTFAFKFVGKKIVGFILWLGNLLMGGDAPAGTGEGGGGGIEPALQEIAQESAFAKMVEKVMIVIALLGAAAFLFLLLRAVWRKLRELLRYLLERLKKYAAASGEDYQDEITDTRDLGELNEMLRSFADRFRRKVDPLKGIDENALAPRERVRFRYRKLWQRHPEWADGKTARENLPGASAADIYDRARYSDHEITAEDAEQFARQAGEN